MKGEFYKMEYEAWDEGTVELSLEQEAAYLRLCHQMYRRGGEIPNSTKLLCSLFRCHHRKAMALLRALIEAGKIVVTERGTLANQKVAKVLDNRAITSNRLSITGRKGGERSGIARRKPLNGHDTPEAFASTPRSRGEEIREEEKKESSLRSPKKPANEHGPPNRGSRLNAAWQPSTSDTDFAAEHGLEPARITATADRFRDHWLGASGHSAVKLDWSAAWRNWVRKDLEDRATGMPKEERRDQFGRRAG
jgi:hypothetical protein